MNEYHIVHEAAGAPFRGTTVIYHCFFCGGVAPVESKRSTKFAELTETEISRLRQLTRGISSVDEAIERFGPPDSDIAGGIGITTPETDSSPPQYDGYRRLRFSGLSDTADVDLTDYGPKGIHFTFLGKYLGKKR